MSPQTQRIDWYRAVGMLLIIAAVYIVLQQFGILNFLVPSTLAVVDMGYGLLFVIGLLTSAHCIAMCGGINLSQCLPGERGLNRDIGTASVNSDDAAAGGISPCCAAGDAVSGGGIGVTGADTGKISIIRPSILYNLGRVASYTLIGALAGALGSAVTFSVAAQGVLKLIAGVFMLLMGISMLNIFPWTRKITPRMPKFIADRVKANIYRGKGPLIVGLLNGLMPCGPLQAAQIYALSTGSPLKGALAMMLFCLGTVPLMFGLGTFGSAAGKKSARKVVTAGAVMVAALGLCMLSQGWNLFGVSGLSAAYARHSDGAVLDIAIDRGPQIIHSTLPPNSYPSIKVEVNRPVKWIINAPPGSINGCNNRFFIREYGIEHEFKPGDNVIEFTPKRKGRIPFSCWMGMISGTITVVGPGETGEGILKKRQRPPKEGKPCC